MCDIEELEFAKNFDTGWILDSILKMKKSVFLKRNIGKRVG